LWLAVKSNQGRVNDLSNALKAREDEIKNANEHRIAMLTTLQQMSAAIIDQTTRTEIKLDALLHAIERKQP
jgi:gamma-glutamyl phosphate reductase